MVSGGVVSAGGGAVTVKLRVAGEVSVLLDGSVARTSKVCGPGSKRRGRVRGRCRAKTAPSSTRHSKVEPASVEVKVKVGVVSVVGPEGPELIVVSGGLVSVPIV